MPVHLLRGRRVLVVEDEVTIALTLECALLDAGCSVVGAFSSLHSALQAANRETVDLAIVDLQLHDGLSFPLIRLLRALSIPTAIISGYTPAILPSDIPDVRFIDKPFRVSSLLALLAGSIPPGSRGGIATPLPRSARHIGGPPRDTGWRSDVQPPRDTSRRLVQDGRTGQVISSPLARVAN